MTTEPLLNVRGLGVRFTRCGQSVAVVEDASFDLWPGEALALVGESGCGKSVTALALMGLLRRQRAEVRAEVLRFEGSDLLDLSERRFRALRGDRIAMIFQEPMTSLNPSQTVGRQIEEVLRAHRSMTRGQARARARELLERVQIAAPSARLDEYPHRLSGGMRQRVMIAMALACDPALLIADEPTTALDVTVQAQILDLLDSLRRDLDMALLLVTHDLGVVAEHADRVAVMYAGRIVETAPTAALFAGPEHPYTVGLLSSIPELDRERDRLPAIPGQVLPPELRGTGCHFAPRCPFVQEACQRERPPLAPMGAGHHAACLRAPLDPDRLGAAA